MNLEKALLERLAEWRPDSGRQTLNASDAAGGWTAAVTADRNDVVGCRVWELALARAAVPAQLVDVQAWGERAATRVKGLLEPLHLLEVDGVRHVALLRSQEPAQRGDALAYYEVLLQGDGGASVRRYQGSRQGDKRREQVPFALTHEVLARLADDLIAAA